MNQGTDVIVLEARNRPGGRVEQTTLADGRIVQLGGEVIGPFHRAYVQLVEELGLTIVPSFPQLPGEDTWVLADGRYVGDGFPWMSDADRQSYAALNEEFGRLAATRRPRRPVVAPRRASGSTACRSAPGCVSAAPRRTWCAPATWRCSRCPRSRWSAPRCWPSCARRRPPERAASTTTRSGSATAWPRARPRSPFEWRMSSATASATPRRSSACACRRRAAA